MKEFYLEVTFRHGRAIAAYLYLPRESGEKSAWTRQAEPGMVIDFSSSGRPIGIEITAPGQVSREALNSVLEELGFSPMTEADLAPLLAA
ncbi:MAG TPA: DUF2283 domain-containing protein [Thermoanaerobaculia bacterium]